MQASSSHTDNYVATSLYILEQPSSGSTSRIRPSCPQSRVRLNLLMVLLLWVYSCLLWPTQYLALCSNRSHFPLDPLLACWRPITCTQVNNTLVLHHIHMDTHIYITSTLFILLHTLLLLLLAGRLPSTPHVGQSNFIFYLVNYYFLLQKNPFSLLISDKTCCGFCYNSTENCLIFSVFQFFYLYLKIMLFLKCSRLEFLLFDIHYFFILNFSTFILQHWAFQFLSI